MPFEVNKEYILRKFEGKGGWTYALIPEISQNKKNPFGWVTVSGFIDGFELKQYKLMPFGNGLLFLPVKASTRKVIGKQAGDKVRVKLSIDSSPIEIPDEIIECFKNEPPEVYTNFLAFTEGEQKTYIDWIYSAKKDVTKIERIVAMMKRVSAGKKYFD